MFLPHTTLEEPAHKHTLALKRKLPKKSLGILISLYSLAQKRREAEGRVCIGASSLRAIVLKESSPLFACLFVVFFHLEERNVTTVCVHLFAGGVTFLALSGHFIICIGVP